MAEEKIRILISLIGKYPDHVDHFIMEKGRYLKKAYLFHTCDSAAPANRQGIISKEMEPIDYGELAEKTIKKLTEKHAPRIEIIPVVYQNAHDLHELQHIIQKIVYTEREEFREQEEIAIDISGGTNIAAAAQMMAVYKFRIDAYHDDSTKEIGERIQKINTSVELENDLGGKAFQVLKTIQDSEFIIQPRPEDRGRPFPDELRKVIKGLITQVDLIKIEGRSVSPLENLIKNNFIERIESYEIYRDVSLHETDEPKWEIDTYNLPAYRITDDGIIAANVPRRVRT